jgi:hypothetical protein
MTRSLLEHLRQRGTMSPSMTGDVEHTFRTSTSSTSVCRHVAATAKES